MDLGVSASLLASSNLLVCLICQRLVPVLCEHCRQPLEQSIKHQSHVLRWRKIFADTRTKIYVRGESCSHCHDLGISGRTIVAEFVWLDDIGRDYIQKSDLLGWRKYLLKNDWQSYADQLLQLIKEGRCDPLDAERFIGELSTEREEQTRRNGKLLNYV